MFGFAKKKPFTRDEFDDAVGSVRERMTQGDYTGGAQAAAALRRSVEARNGTHTLMWGEAHLLEARVAMTLGDLRTGLEHVRAAADVHGDDDEAVRARLAAQLSLGDMLAEMGEFDEAEQVLRDALKQQRDADAVESLSKLLFTQGRFDEAAALAKEAADAHRISGELGRREAAVLLWLMAEKAARPDAPALVLLEPQEREAMLPALADAPASRVIDPLIELRWEIFAELDDDPDAKMRCLVAIAQGARALGRHDDRIRALRDYVELAEPGGGEEAVHALQALALAYEEAGRAEDAAPIREEAERRENGAMAHE